MTDKIACEGDLKEKQTWLDIRGVMGRFRRSARQRALQSEELARLIAGSPHPVLLCGDFNDTPYYYTYRTLADGLLLLAALLRLGVSLSATAQTNPVKVNFESHKIALSGQANSTAWQSVTFTRNFNSPIPVVIMGPAYSVDGHPHAVRVRNVTATGFQWQIDEWDYLTGAHPGNITVHFFAITEGTHVFGSQRWQVGKVTTVNRTNSVVTLTGFQTPPNVLTQVYTTNNNIATNNPRALKTRNSLVTAANFAVNLETQQNYTTAISNESVGYIAVSEGIGYLDGKVLWAYSPGTVGHTVKTFYMGPFTNPVILAQSQTKNDTEPGDLRLSTVPNLVNGSTRVQMRFQEETGVI